MDVTPSSLAEDLAELLTEKTITKALKTTEELDKLTVDEKLNDIERAVYLLSSSGQEVQRISVITNLPDLLHDNHADCMRRVVPKVREVLHVAQSEMQVAASSAFLQILQRELVPIHNYTQTFLQTILLSVNSKDPEVARCWLETLLDVIALLPKDVIKTDILSIAIAKGQLSQSVQSRLSCCKILGKIATKFEPFVIKKEILPVVQSLCQDVDYEVRGCMCYQLDAVARGLGLESTKSAIIPELVELTNDEESYVRVAGLETVVNILSLLDDDMCSTTIIPLVCKFCKQSMQAHDSTLPIVAKQLGRICHELSRSLSDEEKEWFVDFYRKLSRVGRSEKNKNAKDTDKDSPSKVCLIPEYLAEEDSSIECRKNCAFNFPAMVLFVGARQFKNTLYNTLTSLCTDPNVVVRKTISNGFHEVAKSLGSLVNPVQSDLVTLLKDESVEVLQGVVTFLPETLSALARGGGAITEARLQLVSEIIPDVLVADYVISASNNWRLQEILMSNLACLNYCCTNDAIFTKVIPMLFHKLKTARALPVRHAAAHTILLLLRNLKKKIQRDELIERFIDEFCHGKSCHQRNIFIDICRFIMEYYSKTFFKEHFYECVLELTSDPVPNIRLRMCSLLPDLKKLIKLPYDRNLLQQLETSVRKILINERDRDVTAAIKQVVEDLDKIHVQMESVMSLRKNFEEDLADQMKEDHEKQLEELEEGERKFEEERLQARAEKKAAATAKKGDNGCSKIPAPKRGAKSGVSKDVKKNSNTNVASVSSGTSLTPMKELNPVQMANEKNSNLIKSKSTTSIPSVSHIPRRDAQPSRIPLKPKNEQAASVNSAHITNDCRGNGSLPKKEINCKIPVFNASLQATAAGSGSKLPKAGTSGRSGSLSIPMSTSIARKGSAGIMTSNVSARRGSITSGSSTSSELGNKPKTKSGNSNTNGIGTSRKVSK